MTDRNPRDAKVSRDPTITREVMYEHIAEVLAANTHVEDKALGRFIVNRILSLMERPPHDSANGGRDPDIVGKTVKSVRAWPGQITIDFEDGSILAAYRRRDDLGWRLYSSISER